MGSACGGRTEDGRGTPRRHDDADHEEEHDPPAPELAGCFRRPLTPCVLPPGEPVADHQRQAQTEDHLSEQGVQPENLKHDTHGSVAPMRHCFVLRVFTREGVGGNHLGVVTDVSGLTDATMQKVAADLGFSETVFVDWRDGGVPRARIFTPAAELPFAGHPLVGAGWLMNVLGPMPVAVLACTAGEVPVSLEGSIAVIGAPLGERVVRRADLGERLSGWVNPVDVRSVSMPSEYVLVQVAGPGEVASARPAEAGHVMLWAWDGDSIKARFFAPDLGVPEDPATGSAAVALAAVLRDMGHGEGSLAIHQGDEIGAPSRIELRWHGRDVSIGGTVVHDETRELDV